ncbi:MAG: cation-translocating P-type ATPase [Nanoarchaeota archaeon]|nr:cation-translocating P-type ATPase [Nanoarchaeota archaeon]
MLDRSELKNIIGLSIKEVRHKHEKEGLNEIPSKEKKDFFHIIKNVMLEPMFLLLIICGILYFFIGDFYEGVILMFAVLFVIAITILEGNKTQKALEALKDLSSPRALVIREGIERRIAGKEVVKGDIIILNEGDRIPADAIIIRSNNLVVDESLLTGESLPVKKYSVRDLEKGKKDSSYHIYSGTLVVSGYCIAEVDSIGIDTEIGKIGKSLYELKQEKTNLQKEVKKIVKIIGFMVLVLFLFIVFFYGIIRNDYIQGFLTGITMAMALLPEEFPVVLTVFLALGALRMSHKKVLARRQHAIEALGSATILCVDKTGTLTMNKMMVKSIYNRKKLIDIKNHDKIPKDFFELVEYSVLSSQKNPFDPMEKAIYELSEKDSIDKIYNYKNWKLLKEYPLTKDFLAISHVWTNDNRNCTVAAKGAPEYIVDLCHIKEKDKKDIFLSVEAMAKKGLRVIAVAKAHTRKLSLPREQHDFDFEFLGLLGFDDPIRPGVAESIKLCKEAKIKVMMITGDYPITAKKIAKEIGLSGEIITGYELNNLSDDDLKKKIKNVSIFARVVPEQKLRIVNALKSNGEVVAMTGDGVNDAPALKSAHIGIAMGEKGTDVAREAASVVLLDDNFSSIVDGVRTGRRIYDNLKKSMSYLIAVHVPVAGITILSVLFKWPLILLPVHIAILELIIDPTCSVVFEADKEEKNIMKKPPRKAKEHLFNKKTLSISLLQGLFSLLILTLVFRYSLSLGYTEGKARAIGFFTIVFSNLFLILAYMSWSEPFYKSLNYKNKSLIIVFVSVISFMLMVFIFPQIQGLLRFDRIDIYSIILCLIASSLTISWFEIYKKIAFKKG